jgi:hypothetical protein
MTFNGETICHIRDEKLNHLVSLLTVFHVLENLFQFYIKENVFDRNKFEGKKINCVLCDRFISVFWIRVVANYLTPGFVYHVD